MAGYPDLRDFLLRLDSAEQLKRIKAEVDPHLEVSEIVQRVVRGGGPALLFENVRGSRMPLAINLFGSEQRMAMALGVERLDDIGDRIAGLLKPELPVGFGGLREAFGKLGELRSVPPKTVATAACQEVVLQGDEVDLNLLPGIQAWPDDGGIFLNLGLTHTKHPETGARNLGMYRLQQHDRRTVGHALADPQGLQRPSRGGRAARRAPSGRDRVRLRARRHLRGECTAAGGDRRVPVRRLHRAAGASRWSSA